MTTTIYADLTADGTHIALVAGGVDAHENALAAKRLGTLTPLFSKSSPPGGLTVPATWPAVVQLSATFGDAFKPGPALADWTQRQITARTALRESTVSALHGAGLTPYPWQLEGASMIAATGRVLITDEPGTGKTITAILGLLQRSLNAHSPYPIVVVCPASVIDAWVEAWQTWSPHVRAVARRGPKRKELLGTADVYVTSYETARNDAPVAGTKAMRPLTEGLKPAAIVIDECHLIKNPDSQRSKAVRRIAAVVTKQGGAVVALSGTPITHHPGDLYPTLVALEPGAWPAKERVYKRYLQTLPGDYKEEVLGLNAHTEPEFRLCLLGQLRRVAKADVLTQLPPKVYSVRTVELPAEWRKVYDDFEATMLAELPDGQELSVMSVLSVMSHLSALSSAAADVEVTYGPDVDEETGEPKRHVHLELKAPSWKVDALLEILEERPGQQVVVFAPSRQLVEIAREAALKAGYRAGRIVGGQTAKARTETVDAFQAGQLDAVFVTTGAGGVGLTLTAASTVVFLQRPWSLVESIQAEDRCHRIGSERHESIEVIDIVARNTLDSRVRAVLRERAGQLADLVQDQRLVRELLGGKNVERQTA